MDKETKREFERLRLNISDNTSSGINSFLILSNMLLTIAVFGKDKELLLQATIPLFVAVLFCVYQIWNSLNTVSKIKKLNDEEKEEEFLKKIKNAKKK